MDKSGLTKRAGGIVVVNKTSHQLPLFVVTFDPKNVNHAAGYAASMASRLPPSMVARLTAMASRGGGNSGVYAALRAQLGMAPQVSQPRAPPRRRKPSKTTRKRSR